MSRTDQPAFSRPRGSSGFGKNLVVAKTMVPGDVRTEAEANVKADGYERLSEFLRDVVIAKGKGMGALRNVFERRLKAVAEIVPEKDR